MLMETKQMLSIISEKAGKTETEIESMANEQIEKFTGLIDLEVALVIVAKNLGVSILDSLELAKPKREFTYVKETCFVLSLLAKAVKIMDFETENEFWIPKSGIKNYSEELFQNALYNREFMEIEVADFMVGKGQKEGYTPFFKVPAEPFEVEIPLDFETIAINGKFEMQDYLECKINGKLQKIALSSSLFCKFKKYEGRKVKVFRFKTEDSQYYQYKIEDIE